MSAHPWSQSSLPEDTWTTAPAQDQTSSLQPSARNRKRRSVPVTGQDLQALCATPWFDVPQGSVDTGLSPTLSHESQSSRTLNSFSEPDLPLLPPGLDMSFLDDSHWSTIGSNTLGQSIAMPQDHFGNGLMPTPYQTPVTLSTDTIGHGLGISHSSVSNQQQSMDPYPGTRGRLAPRRILSDPFMVQGRPLLPRYHGQTIPGVTHGGQYSTLYSQASGTAPIPVTQSVSNVAGLPKKSAGSGHVPAGSPVFINSRDQNSGLASAGGHGLVPYEDVSFQDQSTSPVPYFLGSEIQDFSNGFPYGQESKMSSDMLSFTQGHHARRPISSSNVSAEDVKPALSTSSRSQQPPSSTRDTSTMAAVGHTDHDEGRYRTHALYGEGPKADGLYHCPFESNANCQHKPTKLKCNYDKFVDSHLKPFRCKVEACAKQEFSSTACLLRHEREAHGMYGHGDRPHLCYYSNCERGIPGNGFPRRYNLFDHMKRVHDHKGEPSSRHAGRTGGAKPQAERKGGGTAGRKRRAKESAAGEPATQRQRVEDMPQQQQQQPTQADAAASDPHSHFAQQPISRPEMAAAPLQYHEQHHRQRMPYNQWTNHLDLPSFQMPSGPNNETDSSSHLNHDREEFYRLSRHRRRD